MKYAKGLTGNIILFGCLTTIALSYYFGNHSLLPFTYGMLIGYGLRVLAEVLEEIKDETTKV